MGYKVLSAKELQDIYVPVPCLVIMEHGIESNIFCVLEHLRNIFKINNSKDT